MHLRTWLKLTVLALAVGLVLVTPTAASSTALPAIAASPLAVATIEVVAPRAWTVSITYLAPTTAGQYVTRTFAGTITTTCGCANCTCAGSAVATVRAAPSIDVAVMGSDFTLVALPVTFYGTTTKRLRAVTAQPHGLAGQRRQIALSSGRFGHLRV